MLFKLKKKLKRLQKRKNETLQDTHDVTTMPSNGDPTEYQNSSNDGAKHESLVTDSSLNTDHKRGLKRSREELNKDHNPSYIEPQWCQSINKRRMLLVFDMNKVLILKKAQLRIITRPHAMQFLTKISQYFDIAIWTSASEKNGVKILRKAFPNRIRELLKFVWYQSKCFPLKRSKYKSLYGNVQTRSESEAMTGQKSIPATSDDVVNEFYDSDRLIPISDQCESVNENTNNIPSGSNQVVVDEVMTININASAADDDSGIISDDDSDSDQYQGRQNPIYMKNLSEIWNSREYQGIYDSENTVRIHKMIDMFR